MKLIAITGSIGTGKTTTAKEAKSLGYNVYDVDGWVRRLYYKKDFIKTIGESFPTVVEDGKVNKRKLRNIVFNHNEELKKLEALIHPFLDDTLKDIIHKNAKNDYIAFIDVALLFEMGWEDYMDFIIVTDVDYEIQKKRVMERDNVTEEHFEQINSVQLDNKAKIALADIVINTGVPKNLIRLELINIISSMEDN